MPIDLIYFISHHKFDVVFGFGNVWMCYGTYLSRTQKYNVENRKQKTEDSKGERGETGLRAERAGRQGAYDREGQGERG